MKDIAYKNKTISEKIPLVSILVSLHHQQGYCYWKDQATEVVAGQAD